MPLEYSRPCQMDVSYKWGGWMMKGFSNLSKGLNNPVAVPEIKLVTLKQRKSEFKYGSDCSSMNNPYKPQNSTHFERNSRRERSL